MSFACSVFGLGRLGAPMAAAIACRGHEVIGVDVDQARVEAINRRQAPAPELGLQAAIDGAAGRLWATTDVRQAVLGSTLSFVVVPTPSEQDGTFSLRYAAVAFRRIGEALAHKDSYHLVVLTSTVLPGATRFGLLPILEAASGGRAGVDFGLCYSPEFIALGSVIRDFLNPDLVLIGELDGRSGQTLESFYAGVIENGAPCVRMSLENAELTKVALNTFVTMKIAYANMLAALCEKLPGGDVDVVTRALGMDRRIGDRYLRGGLPYGGPCFPRDNLALAAFARAVHAPCELPLAADAANRVWADELATRLCQLALRGSTVAVLGIAFKAGSHVTEESPGLHLARRLAQSGAAVIAHGGLAEGSARAELDGQILLASSVRDCVRAADLVVVALPEAEYAELRPTDFRSWPPVCVVDPWRVLRDRLSGQSHIRYLGVGLEQDSEVSEAQLAELWSKDRHGSPGLPSG